MTRSDWRGWRSFGPSWNEDIQLSLSGLKVGKIIWFLSDICCSLFLVYGRAHPADWCQTRWCWLALQRRVVQMVQIANDTLFKGGVQPEYVGCSLHHYAVCGVVRELHCASLCTALCNTARRPAADSAESCDAPFVNIRQQPPSSPKSATPFVMCEQLFSLPPPRLNIEHLVYLAKSNQCVYFDIIISISAHRDKGSTVHNEITKANKLCRPRTNERPL